MTSKRKLTIDDLRAAAERLKNWGRWGNDDEIGTLNHIHPEDILGAGPKLVTAGRIDITSAREKMAPAFRPTPSAHGYRLAGRYRPTGSEEELLDGAD